MLKQLKKTLIILIKLLIIGLLAFFLLLLAGFLAVKFNLTKVAGNIDENTDIYNKNETQLIAYNLPGNKNTEEVQANKVYCQLSVLANYADYNTSLVLSAYEVAKSYDLAEKMILALKIRLKNVANLDTELSVCDNTDLKPINVKDLQARFQNFKHPNIYSWQTGEPWQIIRQAVLKDQTTLEKVGRELKIQPRLLLSVTIVEQLRLYYTQRELFEKVFKPLKILANANKMAWGVMSIKEAAAILVENNLKDINSPFYLGKEYENILNFTTSDVAKERYERLTNERNHYYSYLYGGLIIKQIISQWENANHLINYRPEIIATLFNIGMQNSHPKDNPQVGGSQIKIGEDTYVFGSLAYEFYYSGDLMAEFPYSQAE